MNRIKKTVVYKLIYKFFKSSEIKTELWFKTSNPLLGNISPLNMIKIGRYKKLKAFVKSQLDGNFS